ncbi:hypothetical protein [Acaryochloris marina]|uniref:hypothetical protein n=1 Tax=Acaryochloris marina TaxID=155978 RepID=UPI0011D0D2B9|nr:hypothetical protein [Acaryochloris marina]BDM79875.1 hypothetical protein AM10699_27430 [Acaryochloris marina MBIC10699]
MRQNFSTEKVLKIVSTLLLSILLLVYSPVASAKPIGPCIQEPTGVCTRDINACGNPSVCACSQGYSYNSSVGKCLIDDIALADGTGVEVKSRCATKPQGICTQDINQCGNSSACECPEGSTYSPVVGQCIKPIKTSKVGY